MHTPVNTPFLLDFVMQDDESQSSNQNMVMANMHLWVGIAVGFWPRQFAMAKFTFSTPFLEFINALYLYGIALLDGNAKVYCRKALKGTYAWRLVVSTSKGVGRILFMEHF